VKTGLLKPLLICGLVLSAGNLAGCIDEEEWDEIVEDIEQIDININTDCDDCEDDEDWCEDCDDDHHDDDDDWWFDVGVW
jgi:hypothetical protein